MSNETIVVKSYNINDKDYTVINEVDYNGIHYLIMSNEDNPKDILIRKVVESYLEFLDDENEIREVLKRVVK